MYITPSIYKPGALKSMKLGGNANFGASTDVGAGFKYETEGGFGFASNIVSKDADKAAGMLGEGDTNKWDTQIAYTTDRWAWFFYLFQSAKLVKSCIQRYQTGSSYEIR